MEGLNLLFELEKQLFNKMLKLKNDISNLNIVFESSEKTIFPCFSVDLWEIRENYYSGFGLSEIVEQNNDIVKVRTRSNCYDIHYMFNIFSLLSDEYRKLIFAFNKEFKRGFCFNIEKEIYEFNSKKFFGEYQFNNNYDENGEVIFRKMYIYYVTTVPLDENEVTEYSKLKGFKLKNIY